MQLCVKKKNTTIYAVSGLVYGRKACKWCHGRGRIFFNYRNLCELPLFWLNLDKRLHCIPWPAPRSESRTSLKSWNISLNGIVGISVKVILEKWELIVRKINSLFQGFWDWISLRPFGLICSIYWGVFYDRKNHISCQSQWFGFIKFYSILGFLMWSFLAFYYPRLFSS